MGELGTQILAGGPQLQPLSDHPAIVEVMSTRFTGWELYRARDVIRPRFFKAMTKEYHLHVWAIIESLGGPWREDMGEKEARALAGIIAGEWGVGDELGRAVADGIRDYARRLSPESKSEFKAAAAALARMADHYAAAQEGAGECN